MEYWEKNYVLPKKLREIDMQKNVPDPTLPAKDLTTTFIGSIPRLDYTKAALVNIRSGIPAFVPGYNYTTSEEFWGYFPLLACWQGRVLEHMNGAYTMPAGLCDKIVASFFKGDATGGNLEPIPIDKDHATYQAGMESNALGYIIGVKKYVGQIITFDAQNNAIQAQIPEGAEIVMARMALLESGVSLVESGQTPYASIVFEEMKDGSIKLGSPTLCVRPADKVQPALVAASSPTQKKEDVKAMDKAQMIAQITNLLQSKELPDLQKVLDMLGQVATPEEPKTPEEFSADKVEKIASLAASKVLESLKAATPPPAPQAPEVAARAVYLSKGVPENVIHEEITQKKLFSGMTNTEAKDVAEKRATILLTATGIIGGAPKPKETTVAALAGKFIAEGKDVLTACEMARKELNQ